MDDTITTNAWAAAFVGLPAGTWRGYVTQGKAPRPDGYTTEKGRVVAYWKRSTLEHWRDNWHPRPVGRPPKHRKDEP